MAGRLLDYRIISLILLFMVSLLAMMFDILPVLMAALLSALIWNFFFIPPLFTFHINNAADLLLFAMYFVIACINAVLTTHIRKTEKKARDKEEKEHELKLYSTLFNSLSHEMKTPLAAIISATDAAKDETLSVDNRSILLNQVEVAAHRLNNQVKNLLNMSRLESGLLKPSYEWCDVNEMLILIIDSFSYPPSGTMISFKPDEQLPLCKLDAGLIGQSVQNIIQNAFQYCPDGSRISVAARIEKNELVISISDNGPGVPVEIIDNLFAKFYRGPESGPGGTGLGLSIARGFIEAHLGKIRISLNHPHGLCFSLFIPVETTYINHLKNE